MIHVVKVFQNFVIDDLDKTCLKALQKIVKWCSKTSVDYVYYTIFDYS